MRTISSPLPFAEHDVLYPSPPPTEKRVLQELAQNGHANNDIAYHIQRELYHIISDFDYLSLQKPTRVQIGRIRSLAFEGYFPPESDWEVLNAQLSSEQSTVGQLSREVVARLQQVIGERKARWDIIEENAGGLGLNGDKEKAMVRIWQDHAAVDQFAHDFGGRVVVFGSARLKPNEKDYRAVEWFTRSLVEGLVDESGKSEQIVSGAGPGIMEAANKGAMIGEWNVLSSLYHQLDQKEGNRDDLEQRIRAFRAQIHSAGIRIILPFEAGYNSYLQSNLTIKNFGPRKQGLIAGACGRSVRHEGEHQPWHGRYPATVIAKGGFGTEDEAWEELALLQCGKMPPRMPIILLGKDVAAMKKVTMDTMIEWGTINPKDRDLVIPVGNEVEAVRQYLKFYNLKPNEHLAQMMKKRQPAL